MEGILTLIAEIVNDLELGKFKPLSIPVMLNNEDCATLIDDAELNISAEFLGQQPVTRRLDDAESSRKYAQMMIILAIVTELLVEGKTISLRDVYYSAKGSFKSQSECNLCILEVGKMLGLKRHEMNILPAPKGFVSGLLRFRFKKTRPQATNDDIPWIECAGTPITSTITLPNDYTVPAATVTNDTSQSSTLSSLSSDSGVVKTGTTSAAASTIFMNCVEEGNKVLISSEWVSHSLEDIDMQIIQCASEQDLFDAQSGNELMHMDMTMPSPHPAFDCMDVDFFEDFNHCTQSSQAWTTSTKGTFDLQSQSQSRPQPSYIQGSSFCAEVSESNIDAGKDVHREDLQQPNDVFLLVIEKEGIFHRLVEDRFYTRVPSILVTGCGYPDVATRAMVSKVKAKFPFIQVVGVCDYNPHGLSLLMTYRFSSRATAFEGRGFQTPIKWLGLRAKHITRLFLRSNTQASEDGSQGNPDTQDEFKDSDGEDENDSDHDIEIDIDCRSVLSAGTQRNMRRREQRRRRRGGDSSGRSGVSDAGSRISSAQEEEEEEEGRRWRGGELAPGDRGDAARTAQLQKMTLNDVRKLKGMMHNAPVLQALPKEYEEEMRQMMEGNVKCELEALYAFGLDFVADFFQDALIRGDFI